MTNHITAPLGLCQYETSRYQKCCYPAVTEINGRVFCSVHRRYGATYKPPVPPAPLELDRFDHTKPETPNHGRNEMSGKKNPAAAETAAESPKPEKEAKPAPAAKELRQIDQGKLLETARELRDRVEISLHKLGPGGKSIQTNLNSVVATLSMQNAHPVDEKQADLFGGRRVGQPRAASAAKPVKPEKKKEEPKIKFKTPDPFSWSSDEKMQPSPVLAELIGSAEPITWEDAYDKIGYLTTENPMLEEVMNDKGKPVKPQTWKADDKLKKFFGRDTFTHRDTDKDSMQQHFTRIPEEQEAARARAEAKAKRDAKKKTAQGW